MPITLGAQNPSLNYVAIATTAEELAYAQSRTAAEHNNVIYYTPTPAVYRYTSSWAVDGSSTISSLTKLNRVLFSKPSGRLFYVNSDSTVTAMEGIASDTVAGLIKPGADMNVLADGTLALGQVTAVSPSLDLDFTTGVLDSRISYTRNTIGTYIDSAGVLRTATANVPRFSCNPLTGEMYGLLVESQRTNLVTYSEQLDNWTKSRVTVTSDSVVSPDGTLTADKVIPDTENNTHSIQQNTLTVGGSTTCTWSVYAKAGEYTYVRLRAGDSVGFLGDVLVNLATGTITNPSSAASIVALKDGWYRIILTLTTSASATAATYAVWVYDNAGVGTFAGDGTSGLYVWGGQMEVGPMATSYIPTTTATVTRNADVAQITDLGFLNKTEGTFAATAYYRKGVTNPVGRAVWCLDVGANTDLIGALFRDDLEQAWYNIYVGGTSQLSSNTYGTTPPDVWHRISASYKVNDARSYVDGGSTKFSDTSVTLPTGLNGLRIGSYYGANNRFLNGFIRSLSYYPKSVVDGELQAVSRI